MDEWNMLGGFVDPPEAPAGLKLEVKRDSHLGIVTHWRHVVDKDDKREKWYFVVKLSGRYGEEVLRGAQAGRSMFTALTSFVAGSAGNRQGLPEDWPIVAVEANKF